jgi:hypothetical protein
MENSNVPNKLNTWDTESEPIDVDEAPEVEIDAEGQGQEEAGQGVEVPVVANDVPAGYEEVPAGVGGTFLKRNGKRIRAL